MVTWPTLKKFFKEKKNCLNYFETKKKKKNISISYNVSSEGLVIWVYYDTEYDWNWKRGELIISTLIKSFKLDKVGYKEKPNVLRYNSPYWESYTLTVQYYSPCAKFDSKVFFYNLSFQEYNTEYNF